MTTVAILDFETTGMFAGADRIIEVAAVLVQDGAVTGTFTELMDPGFPIPSFITSLTGISTTMVRGKPQPEEVMPRLRAFLGDHPCLAHNPGFDRRFFTAEMARAGHAHDRPFLCSVLLARRLLPEAGRHSLGALSQRFGFELPPGMRAHRALADALLTTQLWRLLVERTRLHLGREPNLDLLLRLMRVPRAQVVPWLARQTQT
jgi:DNA polymerase-3 subunit epsilon